MIKETDTCSTVRLAGIVRESVVDGPGFRLVVFAQGCPHNCAGCHNPETHPFTGGYICTPEQIMHELKSNPLHSGITLSGGEPFSQAAGFSLIAQLAGQEGYNVITYTGYTFERLLKENQPSWTDLLAATDILVDGPFIREQKNLLLKFRGSENQRVLDSRASLAQRKPVETSF